VLENAYLKGIEDGTVRKLDNFKLFYLSHAHALLEMCKKFVGCEILPSDDFSHAEDELQNLIDTAVAYLKT